MLRRTVSGILVVLLLVGVWAFVFNVKPVKSTLDNWWDSNWTYRRQLVIKENSGCSLRSFPVEFTFMHNGHVRSGGKDIRIIDDSIEIPSCVEEWNSTHVKVVFEINLTALETKTLYIYYGNPNAPTPDYPLVPLAISEGQKNGSAIIDFRIFIGWSYVAWGVQPGWYIVGGQLVYIDNNPVVLWTDFRMDFDNDGNFEEDEDLITDIPSWKGGIGRHHYSPERFIERSLGIGDYIGFVQTPVYVQLNFADAYLRVYKGQNYIETVQADRLGMQSSMWDYAKYKDGIEQNIIDGKNTTGPPQDPTHNTIYLSHNNPGWMAYRDSFHGRIFGAMGFNINSTYMYQMHAKESHAWDRVIRFDYTNKSDADPLDQPENCRIYWYGDGTNGYSEINKTATILSNPPTISVLSEEIIPEFPSTVILLSAITFATIVIILAKMKIPKENKISKVCDILSWV